MSVLIILFALITGIAMGFVLGLLKYKDFIKEIKEN